MSEISDILDGFERLTKVEITMDVQKMREDGTLRKADDYSDDAFFAMIKNRMISTNADCTILTCEAYYKDETLTRTIGVKISRNGEVFKVRYLNVFGYLSLHFTGIKRIRAWVKYITNKQFRLFVQICMRELLWRNSPAFM